MLLRKRPAFLNTQVSTRYLGLVFWNRTLMLGSFTRKILRGCWWTHPHTPPPNPSWYIWRQSVFGSIPVKENPPLYYTDINDAQTLNLVIKSAAFFMFMALWQNFVQHLTTQLSTRTHKKVAKCKWIGHFSLRVTFLSCDAKIQRHCKWSQFEREDGALRMFRDDEAMSCSAPDWFVDLLLMCQSMLRWRGQWYLCQAPLRSLSRGVEGAWHFLLSPCGCRPQAYAA